jgi:hypothetical protein
MERATFLAFIGMEPGVRGVAYEKVLLTRMD